MTDSSLLELFRAELEIHLPVLNEGLLALERDAGDSKRLEALMRAAHSIKGAAKIVGVESAVRVAHVLEDCFVAAQEARIHLGSDAIDVLLRGVDALHRVGGGEAIAEPELASLIETIAAVRTGTARFVLREVPEPVSPNVRPTGDLQDAELEHFRSRMYELLSRGVPRIQLDLAAVNDIDAAALGLLVRAARDAASRTPPIELEVVNVRPHVRTLLRVTRLDERFSIVPGANQE